MCGCHLASLLKPQRASPVGISPLRHFKHRRTLHAVRVQSPDQVLCVLLPYVRIDVEYWADKICATPGNQLKPTVAGAYTRPLHYST